MEAQAQGAGGTREGVPPGGGWGGGQTASWSEAGWNRLRWGTGATRGGPRQPPPAPTAAWHHMA